MTARDVAQGSLKAAVLRGLARDCTRTNESLRIGLQNDVADVGRTNRTKVLQRRTS